MFTANCLIWVVLIAMVFIADLVSLLIDVGTEACEKWGVRLLMVVAFLGLPLCKLGLIGLVFLLAAIWFLNWFHSDHAEQRARGYRFADEISDSLASKYPHLSAQDCVEIVAGLRSLFLIAATEAVTLALPSRAVADAWLALNGGWRRLKCLSFLGPCAFVEPGFVAEGQGSEALSTTWRLCCARELIDQHFPDRLPSLFALDARLAIPGGSRYSIEAENYPTGDPLSPKELVKAIKQRLDSLDAGDARRRALSVLARRIRVSLALESYPHDWTNKLLAQLFDTISARDDLFVATFGDIATADVERARAVATPREPNPGCCAQSADANGGAGARR